MFIAGWNQWKVQGFAEELCQVASTPLNVCRIFQKRTGELIPHLCVLWCMSREWLFHVFNCCLGAFTDCVWFYCTFLWLLRSYTVLHIKGAFSQASQFCKSWLEIVQQKIQGESVASKRFGLLGGCTYKKIWWITHCAGRSGGDFSWLWECHELCKS